MAEQTERPQNHCVGERRKEARYLANEDASVWDLHQMIAGCHPARIVDISRNGIRLESAVRLTQGRQIAVDYRGMIICGTVRYSGRTENRYAMGVLIKDVLDPLREEPAGHSTNHETEADAVLV